MRTFITSGLGSLLTRAAAAAMIIVATHPSAAAQDGAPVADSRAALLSSERDRKADDVAPPERTTVERALYWYDNQYVLPKIFGGWHGFHLAGGDFPAGAGTKFGVGFTHAIGSVDPDGRNRLTLDTAAARSTRGYMRVSGEIDVRQIGGAPLDARVRAQHYKFPQEDFFGVGRDSRTEDRTNYLQEGSEAGGELLWRPARHVELTGGLFFANPTVGSGTDPRFPSIERVFDTTTLPGFEGQPNFLRSDLAIASDWRDNPAHPHAGGRYAVAFSNFDDRSFAGPDKVRPTANSKAYGFRRVTVDVQHYVPLADRSRVLALHAAAVLTDASAGQQVPFFYEPTLGGSQTLRGFREFRFRDRNSLALTAEYRWEAAWFLDGAVFVDAGQVAADRRDFSFRDLDASYGVGLRIHSNRAFVARLDLARSREGFIPLLRFEHVF
jgi:Omp85 superfamily domain